MSRAIRSAAIATQPSRGILARICRTVAVWQKRAQQRQRLRDLDEATLRDLGISRIDALIEGGKPFWRE